MKADIVVVLKDSDGTVQTINGFTEDVPVLPRKWYTIEGNKVYCHTQGGDTITVTPVNMQLFKEKYLDVLEYSAESPFKINMR